MDETEIRDDVLASLDDDLVERTPPDDLEEIIRAAVETTEQEMVDQFGLEPDKTGRGRTRCDDEEETS